MKLGLAGADLVRALELSTLASRLFAFLTFLFSFLPCGGNDVRIANIHLSS